MQVSRNIWSGSGPLQWMQLIICGSAILYFGREIFIPLSFALLISFVLYPISRWFESRGAGRLTSVLISLSFLLLLGFLVVALLTSQVISFMDEWPTLQSKLIKSLQDASQLLIDSFGISKEQQRQTLTNISNQSVGNILVIIRNTVSASAVSLVMMILIPVYVVLVLYYRSYWVNVLFHLFPGEKEDEIREMVSRVVGTYYNFIKGMALVYLIVGSLNSIGLLILGVPHAILFGFIASILTFVPYVGIMVGSLLPITISWATYNSIWYPIGVIGIFSFVQYLEANIIFPIAVSSRLNVNSLVMLVAIFLGGILWGMAGMILFVPFVGIIKLIADHNPKWRVGSVILGADDSQKKFRGKMKR